MRVDGKEFRVIPGHETYFVSSDGEVISTRRNRVKRMARTPYHNGYLASVISFGSKELGRRFRVIGIHRLVATAWISPPPSPESVVNHKNGDKADNRVENLEWTTMLGNRRHSIYVLGRGDFRGEAASTAKLKTADVQEIRKLLRRGGGLGEIARKYGVTRSQIGHIKAGRSWSHLKAE
jgi:hypothetical protein